jgi:hypothetical protein
MQRLIDAIFSIVRCRSSFLGHQNIPFNLLYVTRHGFPRSGLIVIFDGRYDRAMGIDGSLTPTGRLQRLFPAVAQDVEQSGDEFLDGVVLRGLADGEMKLAIRLHAGGAALYLFSLLFE